MRERPEGARSENPARLISKAYGGPQASFQRWEVPVETPEKRPEYPPRKVTSAVAFTRTPPAPRPRPRSHGPTRSLDPPGEVPRPGHGTQSARRVPGNQKHPAVRPGGRPTRRPAATWSTPPLALSPRTPGTAPPL